MAWQRVASINEIDADGVLGVDVDGASVALYRLGNEVFATDGICTHALAILSDGFVEDGKIECPLHQGQFDIRSGKALCAPVTEDLPTYAVKLEGDDVWIDMERPAANAPPVPKTGDGIRMAVQENKADTRKSAGPMQSEESLAQRYVWPAEGLTRIPDWVYTDQTIYEREVEKIFHGHTWNYVALECEVPKAGDFIRSNVGPTPVVVVRAEDGSINVVENRCSHRAAEFCRELSGNV
jgi:phenylpropionate dioxygenase-like ring-hydroxylating dioxygenase large terminal subunit